MFADVVIFTLIFQKINMARARQGYSNKAHVFSANHLKY